MSENKDKKEIKVLSQDEAEPQEKEPSPTDQIERVMDSSYYVDEIIIKTKKLSAIIACLGGLPREFRDDDDFTNLSWAMEGFTDAILELVEGLSGHLDNIGVSKIEKEKQKSEK